MASSSLLDAVYEAGTRLASFTDETGTTSGGGGGGGDGLFSVLAAAQELGEPMRPAGKVKKTKKSPAKGKVLMKPRRPCSVDGCGTLTARYGLCSKHGGADKCRVDGCLKVDRGNGFCTTHDPVGVKVLSKTCKIEGCNGESARWGLCVNHGGVAKCKKDGCTKNAQGCGFCAAHGGGYRCKVDACTKYNQGGGYCMAHGGRGKKKACKIEGCGVVANLFGLCVAHGGIDPCPDATVVSVAVVTAMMNGTVPPLSPVAMPVPAEHQGQPSLQPYVEEAPASLDLMSKAVTPGPIAAMAALASGGGAPPHSLDRPMAPASVSALVAALQEEE